jgi:hypothetical protein
MYNSPVIAGDYNAPLSEMGSRNASQMTSKKTLSLSNM